MTTNTSEPRPGAGREWCARIRLSRKSARPVNVARGTRDKILLHGQAARAQRRQPGARHIDLCACRHVPMSDAPARVAAAILTTTKEARA
jgi:pimeloyl-ACP methyl ester carboxylesterase